MSYTCYPLLARPNIILTFLLYNRFQPPLSNLPSPFIIKAQDVLLKQYPGPLRFYLLSILRFSALISYNGPQILEISENYQSVYLAKDAIEDKLQDDLTKNKVTHTLPDFPFICSLLSFVLKDNSILCYIYNLLYPAHNLINDNITSKKAYLKYIIILNILSIIRQVSISYTLIKRDIADAFYNIPLALYITWLLSF